MIYKDMELFGVVELSQRFNGVQLQRLPESVRNRLNPRGQWNSQQATGLEFRFACEAPHVRLFISNLEGDAP